MEELDDDVPVHRMSSVRFRLYSANDIRSLSVKEITNPRTFDQLQHPTTGGLHDAALGPSERNDVCTTCGQNSVFCPGHMGHIQLPLPVFNPIYFKTLFQILRGCCFRCHRLYAKLSAGQLLPRQIKLLNRGNISGVWLLADHACQLLAETANTKKDVDISQQLDDFLHDNFSEEHGDFFIRFMHTHGPKLFHWPNEEDTCWISDGDIFCVIDTPSIASSRRMYSLSKKDDARIARLLGNKSGIGPVITGYNVYGKSGIDPVITGYNVSGKSGIDPVITGYNVSGNSGIGPVITGYNFSGKSGIDPVITGYNFSGKSGIDPVITGYNFSGKSGIDPVITGYNFSGKSWIGPVITGYNFSGKSWIDLFITGYNFSGKSGIDPVITGYNFSGKLGIDPVITGYNFSRYHWIQRLRAIRIFKSELKLDTRATDISSWMAKPEIKVVLEYTGRLEEVVRVRLYAKLSAGQLLPRQIKLLNRGNISGVWLLADHACQLLAETANTKKDVDISQQLDDFLHDNFSDTDLTEKDPVKNIEAARRLIIEDFVKMHFGPKTKCPHCQCRISILKQEYNARLLLFGSSQSVEQIFQESQKKLEQKKRTMSVKPEVDEEEGDVEIIEMEQDSGSHGDQSSGKTKLGIPDLAVTMVTPVDAREHMRKLWKKESAVLKMLFQCLSSTRNIDHPTDIFFHDIIPVAPPRFRPLSCMGERRYENSQTANLCKLLEDNQLIKEILQQINKTKEKENTEALPESVSSVPGETLTQKLQFAWSRLQAHVNCVIDSSLDRLSTDKQPGIKQLLEKKEGLFRKHMMGKRVNFAARSVISPDPCINTNEIGVPDVFAKKLTYPQPVTPWNFHELQQAVINGPVKHPGATMVINEKGLTTRLSDTNHIQREAIAKTLLTPSVSTSYLLKPKMVLRHLKNGDFLLLNRQPSLHKPSMQAHRVRVLTGQKTLRMHYSNCKAYNADFDGDEMNAHFVQSELARAEAAILASTDSQYLVPKDGTPLAGLIQDHMVSGVWLTVRGTFFNRVDYCQLLYASLPDNHGFVKDVAPAIIKPRKLWSGKQIVSSLLMNIIPDGRPLINMDGKSKIPEKSWQRPGRRRVQNSYPDSDVMGEGVVVIRGAHLLQGVLDKGHYGPTPFGLVHCCYEMYGGEVAGKLITSLGKLFRAYLQIRGFTLGVEDILVTKHANKLRKNFIAASPDCAVDVVVTALAVDPNISDSDLVSKMRAAHLSRDDRPMRELDLAMKSKTDEIQNNITRACMPHGLHKAFPYNNLQLMVQSGAKGSTVNSMQISCLLGQIELEGRRPPLMMCGRALPSFLPYDPTPRAGGFVTGRFLTGIAPPEYFFHCMAGREFQAVYSCGILQAVYCSYYNQCYMIVLPTTTSSTCGILQAVYCSYHNQCYMIVLPTTTSSTCRILQAVYCTAHHNQFSAILQAVYCSYHNSATIVLPTTTSSTCRILQAVYCSYHNQCYMIVLPTTTSSYRVVYYKLCTAPTTTSSTCGVKLSVYCSYNKCYMIVLPTTTSSTCGILQAVYCSYHNQCYMIVLPTTTSSTCRILQAVYCSYHNQCYMIVLPTTTSSTCRILQAVYCSYHNQFHVWSVYCSYHNQCYMIVLPTTTSSTCGILQAVYCSYHNQCYMIVLPTTTSSTCRILQAVYCSYHNSSTCGVQAVYCSYHNQCYMIVLPTTTSSTCGILQAVYCSYHNQCYMIVLPTTTSSTCRILQAVYCSYHNQCYMMPTTTIPRVVYYKLCTAPTTTSSTCGILQAVYCSYHNQCYMIVLPTTTSSTCGILQAVYCSYHNQCYMIVLPTTTSSICRILQAVYCSYHNQFHVWCISSCVLLLPTTTSYNQCYMIVLPTTTSSMCGILQAVYCSYYNQCYMIVLPTTTSSTCGVFQAVYCSYHNQCYMIVLPTTTSSICRILQAVYCSYHNQCYMIVLPTTTSSTCRILQAVYCSYHNQFHVWSVYCSYHNQCYMIVLPTTTSSICRILQAVYCSYHNQCYMIVLPTTTSSTCRILQAVYCSYHNQCYMIVLPTCVPRVVYYCVLLLPQSTCGVFQAVYCSYHNQCYMIVLPTTTSSTCGILQAVYCSYHNQCYMIVLPTTTSSICRILQAVYCSYHNQCYMICYMIVLPTTTSSTCRILQAVYCSYHNQCYMIVLPTTTSSTCRILQAVYCSYHNQFHVWLLHDCTAHHNQFHVSYITLLLPQSVYMIVLPPQPVPRVVYYKLCYMIVLPTTTSSTCGILQAVYCSYHNQCYMIVLYCSHHNQFHVWYITSCVLLLPQSVLHDCTAHHNQFHMSCRILQAVYCSYHNQFHVWCISSCVLLLPQSVLHDCTAHHNQFHVWYITSCVLLYHNQCYMIVLLHHNQFHVSVYYKLCTAPTTTVLHVVYSPPCIFVLPTTTSSMCRILQAVYCSYHNQCYMIVLPTTTSSTCRILQAVYCSYHNQFHLCTAPTTTSSTCGILQAVYCSYSPQSVLHDCTAHHNQFHVLVYYKLCTAPTTTSSTCGILQAVYCSYHNQCYMIVLPTTTSSTCGILQAVYCSYHNQCYMIVLPTTTSSTCGILQAVYCSYHNQCYMIVLSTTTSSMCGILQAVYCSYYNQCYMIFYYGEDGLDVMKTPFLTPKQFPFLVWNRNALDEVIVSDNPRSLRAIKKINKKINSWKKKEAKRSSDGSRSSGFLRFYRERASDLTGNTDRNTIILGSGRIPAARTLEKAWFALSADERRRYSRHCQRCPDPVMSVYKPSEHPTVLSEKIPDLLEEFDEDHFTKILKQCPSHTVEDFQVQDFRDMLMGKVLRSMAEPGEAVGLLCAQSIGEPSTQMTLNTFHFAGRGEMNVTLGIPRLREIIMVASATLKTPSMDITVRDTGSALYQARKLQKKLNKVVLSQVLQDVEVSEMLSINHKSKFDRYRKFSVRFVFLPHAVYKENVCLRPRQVLHQMEESVVAQLIDHIKLKMKAIQQAKHLNTGAVRSKAPTEQETTGGADGGDDEELSDAEPEEGSSSAVRDQRRQQESQEYDGEEQEKEMVEDNDDNDLMVGEDTNEAQFEEEFQDELLIDERTKKAKMASDNRIQNVKQISQSICDYKYDTKNSMWCQLTLQYGLTDSKIDITSLIEEFAKKAVIHQVRGITRAFLVEEKRNMQCVWHLKTEGVNIQEMYKYADILDVNQLYTNDVHAFARIYGIEAAAKVLIKEIKNVFGAYGIQVDYRHLSLLADYMTFEGSYKPLNRNAIESNASPFQKMTFETTMNFLAKACLHDGVDFLKSPSSRIVTGRVVACGTGCFEILQPLV
ncbi:uncharacterized protein LOC121376369 [Gigantopelta aegis]|uniref:uncharacterized protein LOC121376369 n=1 Tax=Gigantopelta aegis TaxID=1735272 RepID=UPI001B88755D|nr:uncharacterized protein LOC121376369 [Gigantopelta aegis]